MAGQTITKSEFEDFICLYMLNKMTGDKAVNPKFAQVMTKIKNAGMQSILYNYFQNVKASSRVKYKIFTDSLKNGEQTNLFINENEIKDLIEYVVKRAINKENLNVEKLKLLQENVIEYVRGEQNDDS